MPVTKTQDNIIEEVVKDIISEECNQPYLQDETVCCLDTYTGCCCKCKYQLPIHADFPTSSLYCFVCLKRLGGHFFINTKHGHCSYYSNRKKNDNAKEQN